MTMTDRSHVATLPHVVSPETIATIRELWRQRRFAQDTRKRIDQGTLSLVRSYFGYRTVIAKDDYDTDKLYKAAKKANDAIPANAAKLIKQVESGLVSTDDRSTAAHPLAPYILHAAEARRPFDVLEATYDKQLRKLIRTLPAWAWAKEVKGISELGIAAIVGGCGDLSNYSAHSKVWKRMGLHVVNGKACSTWRYKGGLSAAEWVQAGYVPRRCSVAYNISDGFVKQGEHYREVYDQRKEYELTRTDLSEPLRKCDAHMRAKRYAVKKFLKDFWREWNRPVRE